MGHLKEFLLLHIIECVHQLPIGLLGYNGDALFNWNVLLYQCHHQMSKYHWEMLVRGASARCILLKIPGKFSTNYFSLNTENMDLSKSDVCNDCNDCTCFMYALQSCMTTSLVYSLPLASSRCSSSPPIIGNCLEKLHVQCLQQF